MQKVFVSYRHRSDQIFKDAFVRFGQLHRLLEDYSVWVGDIDDKLPPQTIRRIIRDNYLRESNVTVLLCGEETKHRKHIDWEIKSSMINGAVNKKSGILVVQLPSIDKGNFYATAIDEWDLLYPGMQETMIELKYRSDIQDMFEYLPERIVDQMLPDVDANISIVRWQDIYNRPENAKFLLDRAAAQAPWNSYDLSRPMRMRDYNPILGR